jgi:Uma2 family endonuclease
MTRQVGGGLTKAKGPRRGPSQTAVALNVPPSVRLQTSSEGFLRLCRANPDLLLERSARGVIEIMSPTSGATGSRNALLTARLVTWAVADGTGKAFDSSTGFSLPNGAARAPDASWVALAHWNDLTAEHKEEGFVPLCPDFVAELRSRSNRLSGLRKKLGEYLDQGARLGWLIDPETLEVEVYRPGRPVEVLKRPATLSGEDVLPGFVLDLKGILFD